MADQLRPNDFSQLKSLIQRDQRLELEELRAVIEGLESRQLAKSELKTNLSHELTEAIADMPEDRRDRLTNTLSKLLSQSVDSQIRENEPVLIDRLNADASGLVKRGIAQALAEFSESLQEQINGQLSFGQRAKNQVEAIRQGTSEANVVLQNTIQGEPKRALLLHRKTGLLIAAASAEKSDGDGDDEALKGSLISAIIGFAEEAMGSNRAGNELSTLKFGDRSLILSVQPLAVLAVEYEGVAPGGVNSWADDSLDELMKDHYDTIVDFNGDLGQAEKSNLEQDLARLLHTVTPDAGSSALGADKVKQGALAQVQAALPLSLAFLAIAGVGFFMTRAIYANNVAHRATNLAIENVGARGSDFAFDYYPSNSSLRATDGLIVGHDTFDRLQSALKNQFEYANLDLSQISVLDLDGLDR